MALTQEVEKAEGGGGEEQEGFGGVLRRRQRASEAGDAEEDASADPESTQKLLDAYFGSDEAQLGEDDRFLKKFIANKARSCYHVHVPLRNQICCCVFRNSLMCLYMFLYMSLAQHVLSAVGMASISIRISVLTSMQGWLEKEDEGYQAYGPEDEEDEEHIERAERFESEYNHRFEVHAHAHHRWRKIPPSLWPFRSRHYKVGEALEAFCVGPAWSLTCTSHRMLFRMLRAYVSAKRHQILCRSRAAQTL